MGLLEVKLLFCYVFGVGLERYIIFGIFIEMGNLGFYKGFVFQGLKFLGVLLGRVGLENKGFLFCFCYGGILYFFFSIVYVSSLAVESRRRFLAWGFVWTDVVVEK